MRACVCVHAVTVGRVQLGPTGHALPPSPPLAAPPSSSSSSLQVVVEPSGAAGVAAALAPGFRDAQEYAGCRRVGVILCGGNVDLEGAVPGFWRRWLEAGGE